MTRAKRRPDPEARAQEILADLGITHSPIPVDAVARKLGITLTFVPLDEALSGMIFMNSSATNAVRCWSRNLDRRTSRKSMNTSISRKQRRRRVSLSDEAT